MNPYNSSNNQLQNHYQDNTAFRATFHDGYIFRNLIEYIKKCNQKANIIFSKNEISLSEMNNNGTILNEFKIYTSNIVEYKYQSDNDYYMVSLDVNTLYNHLKSIQKKDTLRIFKRMGRLAICIQKISSYRQDPPSGSMLAPLLNNNHIYNYIPPKFTIQENNPTCNAPINEFYDECKKLKDQKYESITIRGSEKGISIFANNDGGSRTSTNLASFGRYVPNNSRSTTNSNNLIQQEPNQMQDQERQREQGHERQRDQGQIQEQETPSEESNIVPFTFDFNNINFDNLTLNTNNTIILPTTQPLTNTDGVNVHIKTIQSFMVLKSISGNGIIKFYYEKLPHQRPDGTTVQTDTLKCIVNIGTCGILRTYIRSYIP